MRTALVFSLCLVACRSVEVDASAPTPPRASEETSPKKLAETAPPPVASANEIHGQLRDVDGQRVLHVWGTPQQMGYAHGALLRDEIIEVLGDYALSVIPVTALNAAGAIYGTTADIPETLRQEAQGIVEGMRAHGGAELDALGREITATDLLVLNAMTDLLSIGCSSLSAWGVATQDDPELAGGSAIVRNLDWADDDALLRNQIVIASEPSDPARQPVVSVAFAGYIGCLSCINEAGVTALFNMGYGDGAADLSTAMEGFAPANLLLRDALERRDVDDDGRSSGGDVETALRAKKHAGSYIVHVVEPTDTVGQAAPARIMEVEASGVQTRSPAADALGENLLAATNHLRAKEGPQACSRYARIEQTSRRRDRAFDRDALWKLGRSVRMSEVVHTMLVEPGTRRLTLWLRTPGESERSRREPTVHTWDALFARSD